MKNFFQHQDSARKQSTRLVLLFLLAVVAVAGTSAFVVAIGFGFLSSQSVNSLAASQSFGAAWLTQPAFLWAFLIMVAIIGLGSAFKAMQLGGNGIRVALAMDGKHVHPDTRDPAERQLLNIITEMALASGNPVPKVFLMPGSAINAFAAGYNRHQTVIGVSVGALDNLSRDELQGVVAHEFSHINFGDVKINMRLVALLHGILLIGLIGRILIYTPDRRWSRNSRSSGTLPAGIALIAIGYVGTFLGNWIKAAVSRQREFLADASAVQFTRNPDGIANALKKIAGAPIGTGFDSPEAQEYNHFYFSNRLNFMGGMFSTHPPIAERVKRLGRPLGKAAETGSIRSESDASASFSSASYASEQVMGFQPGGIPYPQASGNSPTHAAIEAEHVVASVGMPTSEHLRNTREDLASLPSPIEQATHTAFGARALIYGLIIDQTSSDFRGEQQSYLAQHAHPATVRTLNQLLPDIATLSVQDIFHVVLMSEPALQDQSAAQSERFKKCCRRLIETDKKVSLLEWCLFRLAISPLSQRKKKSPKQLKECQAELSQLFFYAITFTDETARLKALNEAQKILGMALEKPSVIAISQLDKAMNRLADIKALEKPRIIKALYQLIDSDNVVTDDEFTLLRMLALILDCPLPNLSTERLNNT